MDARSDRTDTTVLEEDLDGDSELTELAAHLRLAVGRLHRRIRIDGRESIPPLQLSALVTVETAGPLRLSELARREAVTAPTMSRVLSALDEQGLVVRAPDPQDARGVLITLSALGATKLNEVRTTRTALVARRLARLDGAQRSALAAALPALEALLVDDE
ncbi:MarR family transcriptional regulator [Pseudonocardia sp. KRD-184]|uniref:MarR family transcriptional regulator n=1 Tax=Pseudonocardia oceani TaxID=2792013 RepID=A0ABS6UIC2_9PSEU|nr:MarR family transcriptional regulator [Pseudonocardia oceani]MBW0090871.1 MarR family transcriptional regulator [Pseudonocardia oceani]MBW0096667.1 MarR family transcriptional regulator [Pseudonocardia oceani]MBW0110539.1 MarR family transcriptional regulator [Pseudonocardia oceani]MBW0122113.1 MarR family transcriptional regulator [Pseudonocardia oceani]MBW0131985.1 MarR family transcriptional regulator [Pseudonocardia oceani]